MIRFSLKQLMLTTALVAFFLFGWCRTIDGPFLPNSAWYPTHSIYGVRGYIGGASVCIDDSNGIMFHVALIDWADHCVIQTVVIFGKWA